MNIRKAVITAAGRDQRALPLQTLTDRDGSEKPVLCILCELALGAGIEEICVVTWPGDEARYSQAVARHGGRVHFLPQPEPLGYGHALWCAHEFTGGEPFLHLVGDHVPVSADLAEEVVALARAESCSVSAVQATRESLVTRYGSVGGRRTPGRDRVYRVETVIEKPTPTEAEQKLMVPGIRAGHYLCFFGIHVLTPAVMDLLDGGGVGLSEALGELSRREQYLAVETRGRRFDLGAPYGLLSAQLALGLSGPGRAQVLSLMVELLASGTAE